LRATTHNAIKPNTPIPPAPKGGEELALNRLDYFRHAKGGSPTAEVRLMIEVARDAEITAVPTFVFAGAPEGQAWMVPGAQDAEVFVTVLRRLAARQAAAQSADDGVDD
jgi:predicted DsbA family dithiol-disulfide isomerase